MGVCRRGIGNARNQRFDRLEASMLELRTGNPGRGDSSLLYKIPIAAEGRASVRRRKGGMGTMEWNVHAIKVTMIPHSGEDAQAVPRVLLQHLEKGNAYGYTGSKWCEKANAAYPNQEILSDFVDLETR